ncbi:MAG: hypothetical protein R3E97_19615 [Candidatus Eisenbacteria bacterium]
MLDRFGWPLPLSFAAALVLGGMLGAVQGGLVARLGILPFIATLGGMLVFQERCSSDRRRVDRATPCLPRGGQSYLPPMLCWIGAGLAALVFVWFGLRSRGTQRLRNLGLAVLVLGFTAVMNAYEGIPVPVVLVLVLGTLLSMLARRTTFGRHLYAIGGNREAAFYAGIPIGRRIVFVFTLMGMCCVGSPESCSPRGSGRRRRMPGG